MQLTIDLSPDQEAQLRAAADAEGLEPLELVRKLLSEHLPERSQRSLRNGVAIDSENQAAIGLLDSWIERGGAASLEEANRSDAEAEELLRNLNANRVAIGERSLFP